MADNFSTSIRDLQNMPEIQEPIQYEGTNNRLSMDTEIHQAMNMANKINKKLEDYKENMTEFEQYGSSIPEEVQKEEWYIKVLNSLKDTSNKNDLFVIFVLIVIVFSLQFSELITKNVPVITNQTDIMVVAGKALLITILYHVIKKLLL